jgi:hypothetical protein
MPLVTGDLMPERSKNIAGGTGVMGTSELELPRVYWALCRIEVEGIVSFYSMIKFFALDVPLKRVVAVSMDPAPDSALAPSFLGRPLGQLPTSHYTPFAP